MGPKPKTKQKPKKENKVRVSFLVSLRFCLSGVVCWAKISLAYFSGGTHMQIQEIALHCMLEVVRV